MELLSEAHSVHWDIIMCSANKVQKGAIYKEVIFNKSEALYLFTISEVSFSLILNFKGHVLLNFTAADHSEQFFLQRKTDYWKFKDQTHEKGLHKLLKSCSTNSLKMAPGCYLLLEGPACGSSAGRWCSSARCCGGRPCCRLAAGRDAPTDRVTKHTAAVTCTQCEALKASDLFLD